jgi:hypothetical protein
LGHVKGMAELGVVKSLGCGSSPTDRNGCECDRLEQENNTEEAASRYG